MLIYKSLVGILLLTLLLFSCKPKNYEVLPVEEFAELITDENVQRLDIRTVVEYSEDHIPGSLNINIRSDNFAAMVDSTLQKHEPVALYCRNGLRSGKAAQILAEKGYVVYILDGGLNAWKEAGEQVVR